MLKTNLGKYMNGDFKSLRLTNPGCPYGKTRAVFFFLLAVFDGVSYADAQESVKHCASVDVKSIIVSQAKQAAESANLEPSIALDSVSSIESRQLGIEKLEFSAFGPILTTLDSNEIRTDVSCLENGFAVTAMISHVESPVLKNPSWRPRIRIIAVRMNKNTKVQIKWRMVEDGAELDRVPSEPVVKLPLVVEKGFP
jgi:hypothetical protein